MDKTTLRVFIIKNDLYNSVAVEFNNVSCTKPNHGTYVDSINVKVPTST